MTFLVIKMIDTIQFCSTRAAYNVDAGYTNDSFFISMKFEYENL